jgi:GTPase involved in cell partitioning and DNA repair
VADWKSVGRVKIEKAGGDGGGDGGGGGGAYARKCGNKLSRAESQDEKERDARDIPGSSARTINFWPARR